MLWKLPEREHIVPTHTGAVFPSLSVFVDDNIKSDWQEITSSAPINGNFLYVHAFFQSTVTQNNQLLFDIGIGAAGSETTIISNFHMMPSNFGYGDYLTYKLPIQIIQGNRYSFRAQVSNNSVTSTVGVTFLIGNSDQRSFAGIDALGSNPLGSTSTVVFGGTGWVALQSSTSRPYKMLFVRIKEDDLETLSFPFKLEIGVGAIGSEAVIIGGLYGRYRNGGDRIFPRHFGPFAINIPQSSRLCARITGDAVAYLVSAHGVY